MAKARRNKPTTKHKSQGAEAQGPLVPSPKCPIGSEVHHEGHDETAKCEMRNPKSDPTKAKKRQLFVDLEVCAGCAECVTKCDYFYHPENNGMLSLRERATMSIVCRRCENPVCVSVCTRDALEKDREGILRRYTMRCVGCKSCSIACPFGTLFPEVIPYAVSVCDYCAGRLRENEVPVCVESCPLHAVRFEEVGEDTSTTAERAVRVDDQLVAHALPWKKEGVKR